MDNEYKMSELTQKADVTKRTVHFYINKGLIPPAIGSGVNSFYTDEHYYRILLIKKLKENYLPLDKIQQMVAGLSIIEIKEKLEGTEETTEIYKVNEPKINLEYPIENIFDEKYKDPKGKEIIKYNIGRGIELSVPKEVLHDDPYLIESAIRYLKRIINEG